MKKHVDLDLVSAHHGVDNAEREARRPQHHPRSRGGHGQACQRWLLQVQYFLLQHLVRWNWIECSLSFLGKTGYEIFSS